MQSSFGAPRPLPGQRGHNQRESKKLESEARKMEQRLQALRSDLNKSRLERENSGTNAGGGWRSARADRGGLKSYAKDARSRKPTRRAQPKANGSAQATASMSASVPASASASASASMPASASAPAPAPAAPADPSSSSVSHWGVTDVGAWLGRIGLERHAPTFASNEIDGPLLLELGLDDLDYMEVKVLAHRKALLKGVADLKRGGSGEVENRGGNANGGAGKPKQGKGVHWSHVKPLSENAVTGGAPPVNLADGAFDERANRKEFLDALNEWRRGGSSSAPVRIVQDDGVGDGSVQVVQEAVADVGGADGMWHNPADGSAAAGTGTGTGTGTEGGGGGGLLRGELDEAKEHEDFVKAVNAWRTGSKPPPVVTAADGGKGKGATSASTATSAEDKACCWLTFETFDKATGHFDKEVGQWFKNEHNAKLYREKQALEEAGRAQRREQLVRQQQLLREDGAEAKGTADVEAKGQDRDAEEYDVDEEDEDDDDGFDADAYDVGRGRAQPKANAPAATVMPRSPIQVKELAPDDKRWDEASDEDTPCCVVVEPDDAEPGANDSMQAEAKQECTVQDYDKIRQMDVKF